MLYFQEIIIFQALIVTPKQIWKQNVVSDGTDTKHTNN